MSPPLITIVDDDVPFLGLMAELLSDEGYRTIGCETTREGLAVVGHMSPDLVILDLRMETRDAGWHLLDRLRNDPRTAAIPVLICSADHRSLSAHRERMNERGCMAVAKPFDIDDMVAAVRRLLSGRHEDAETDFETARDGPSSKCLSDNAVYLR